MREFIDGAAFKSMIICAAMALDENKQQINDLNVFPVPDGDTGTNMSLTIASAVSELNGKPADTVTAVADAVASATLRGARGNSGVILSLLFRGMAKSLKGKKTVNSYDLAVSLAEGVDAAYKAVMKPAEGTILTVSRVSTTAAVEFAETGSDLELMLICALESAKEALAKTVDQNPVLKKAGVIDAGGKGYVVILDAMLASLQGRKAAVFEPEAAPVLQPHDRADFSAFEDGDIQFAYCTEFIVTRENDRSPDLLRGFLEKIGDSVVVVDDDEIIKTHVHSNEPGRVLTEALLYGSLLTVKIENMREQHTALGSIDEASPTRTIAVPGKKFGTVSVCAGAGMASLFKELGVDRIVTGGQTMNPSTDDILREIDRTPAEVVFVLPNNKNVIMAAQQCVPLSEKQVVVIPTASVPEGVSAMLALDPSMDVSECANALSEAARRVHTALITYAARDSLFDGHDIKAGEYLGLYDGALLGSFTDLPTLLDDLHLIMAELNPDFISVYYGEDVSEEAATATSDAILAFFPNAEISLINGGQPVYSYMISAE